MFKYLLGMSVLFYAFNMIVTHICKEMDDFQNKFKYVARIELIILAIMAIYTLIQAIQ